MPDAENAFVSGETKVFYNLKRCHSLQDTTLQVAVDHSTG